MFGLQFIETLTQAEKKACNTEEGPFEMINHKFKPQHNEIVFFFAILILQ